MPNAPTRERKRSTRNIGPREQALADMRTGADNLEQIAEGLQADEGADIVRQIADDTRASADETEAVLERIDALHDEADLPPIADAVTIITSAAEPDGYDYGPAFVRTIELLPYRDSQGRQLRSVQVHPDYVQSQSERYASGLHAVMSSFEFTERVSLQLIQPIPEAAQEELMPSDGPDLIGALRAARPLEGEASVDADVTTEPTDETTVQELPGGVLLATGTDALSAIADAKLAQLEANAIKAMLESGGGQAEDPATEQRLVLASPRADNPAKWRPVNHRIQRVAGQYGHAACGIAGRILGDPATPAAASPKSVQAAVMCESEACGGTEPVKAGTSTPKRKGRGKAAPKPKTADEQANDALRDVKLPGAEGDGEPPKEPPAKGDQDGGEPPKEEPAGKPEGEQSAPTWDSPRAAALALIEQLLSGETETVLAGDICAKLDELKAAIEAIPAPSARGDRRRAAAGASTTRKARVDLPEGAPETAPDHTRADGTKVPKLLRAVAEGPFLIGAQIKKGKYTTIVRDTRDDTDRDYATMAEAKAELTTLLADVPQDRYEELQAAATARLGKDGTGR